MADTDLERVRQLIHDAGKGVLGVRLLAEDLIWDMEQWNGSADAVEDVLARLRLLRGYCDVYGMTMGNINRVYLRKDQHYEQARFVDIAELVNEACVVFDHIGQYDLGVRVKLFRRGQCTILARESDIRRMIMNMLDNATKYSFRDTPGSGTRAVEVFVAPWEESGASITVRNYGNGILQSEIAELPHSGKRGLFAIADGKAGMGLGIGEIERAVEEHQGSFSIESRPAPRDIAESDVVSLLEGDKRAAYSVPWITTVVARLRKAR